MKTIRHIFTPLMLLSLLLWSGSCTDETDDSTGGFERNDNLAISISSGAVSRGGGPEAIEPLPSTVASGLQLYTFSNDTPSIYRSRIDVREVDDATVKGTATVGTWNLAMNYFPQAQRDQRIAPQAGAELDTAPLFDYTAPGTPGDGATEISNSAPEIFTYRKQLTIQRDVVNQVTAQLARNVAMVELKIIHSTESFNTTTGVHRVYLNEVPKTLSYGGKLLRSTGAGTYEVNTTQPDILPSALKGHFVLRPHDTATGKLQSDVVRFIIPAHVGDDFWSIDANGNQQINPNATDTLKRKMYLTIDLERPSGQGRFRRSLQIPTVAHANTILRVDITVAADMTISTNVLPWNYVSNDQGAGAPESRWIYVKQGSNGTGLSWSDAVGTIADGIAAYQKFSDGLYAMLGVIVAGGPSRIYNESIDVTTGIGDIKIYGGYEGVPGTELVGPTTPRRDFNRRLNTHKAIISGDNYIKINDKVIRVDGFRITDPDVTRTNPPLIFADGADNGKSLLANAVEILSNKARPDVNIIKAENNENEVMITNMLIAENDMKLDMTNAKVSLVNATIVKNGYINLKNVYVVNTALWQNFPSSLTEYSNVCLFKQDVGEFSKWPLTEENESTEIMKAPFFDLNAANVADRYKFTSLLSVLHENSMAITKDWFDPDDPSAGIMNKYGIEKDAYGSDRSFGFGTMDVGAFAYGTTGFVMTITAKWTATTWTIIEKKSIYPEMHVIFPTPPTHPDPNYEFRGWFSSDISGTQLPSDGFTMPYESINVWALYKPKEHLVTFDGNGATEGTMNQQAIAYGVETELFHNKFIRTGHYFSGWGLVPQGPKVLENSALYTPTADVTLYAQWLPL